MDAEALAGDHAPRAGEPENPATVTDRVWCGAGPRPDPRVFCESGLALAGRGAGWHDHGRARLADRGAIIRRVSSASTLLAATGFTMTEVGTLSLEGLWGNEAPIFVFVDD